MRSTHVAAAALATLLGACPPLHAQVTRADREEAREQVRFGIEVAKRGLWREAAYRFTKAADIDPTYAGAFNNLGVAYEQAGRFENARRAYEQALALDPGIHSYETTTRASGTSTIDDRDR